MSASPFIQSLESRRLFTGSTADLIKLTAFEPLNSVIGGAVPMGNHEIPQHLPKQTDQGVELLGTGPNATNNGGNSGGAIGSTRFGTVMIASQS